MKTHGAFRVTAPKASVVVVLALGFTFALPVPTAALIFERPTYSSPIAISANDQLIWVVNPSDDSVSVIRPDNNTRIAKITVGDEPQSITLTPDNLCAFVANAAGNSISIIDVNNPAWGAFSAAVDMSVGLNGQLTT